MPINHVSLATGPSSFKALRDFYVAALKPLGFSIYKESSNCFLGLQAPRAGPDFWLHCGGEDFPLLDPSLPAEENLKGRGRTHVAFDAGSNAKVDEWYKAAV